MKKTTWAVLLGFIFVLLAGCVVARPSFAPPPLKKEVRAVKPGPNFIWTSGHWKWSGSKYYWVSGRWTKNRRSHTWVTGHWARKGNHWVYIKGHWRRR
jgi:hypothetical protein